METWIKKRLKGPKGCHNNQYVSNVLTNYIYVRWCLYYRFSLHNLFFFEIMTVLTDNLQVIISATFFFSFLGFFLKKNATRYTCGLTLTRRRAVDLSCPGWLGCWLSRRGGCLSTGFTFLQQVGKETSENALTVWVDTLKKCYMQKNKHTQNIFLKS